METRANYVLIGAFTLAGAIGILALMLWFARVELDRQFATYEIEFTTVSGLGRASEVRFGGLLVGQVTQLRLSPEGTGAILVEIQVDAATPVRVDSLATIEEQVVTGVSYVAIDAGSPDAPLLARISDASPPRIEAGQSTLQTLSRDAPDLLAEALLVTRQLNALFDTENRERIDRILRNSEEASAALSQTLRDLSATTGAASGIVGEARRFNAGWEALIARLGGVADAAETTLSRLNDLADETSLLLDDGADTLRVTKDLVSEADRFLDEDASQASEALRLVLVDLRRELGRLSEEARQALAPIRAAGTAAAERLAEAEATLAAVDAALARFDEAFGAVGGAAASFGTLVEGDARDLAGAARDAIDEATRIIDETGDALQGDLPQTLTDLRMASATAMRVMNELGTDLSAAFGRIDALSLSAQGLIEDASSGLTQVDTTLRALESASKSGGAAFQAAEGAFSGAERTIDEDIRPLAAELRGSMQGLNASIALIAERLPQIATDLGTASRSAAAAFDALAGVVARTGPALDGFTARALPGYARLAQEARALVGNLDRMVGRLDRNPGRFLLDDRAPAFRR